LSSARALLPEESESHQRDRAELDEYGNFIDLLLQFPNRTFDVFGIQHIACGMIVPGFS
jgi:hypothetical protein